MKKDIFGQPGITKSDTLIESAKNLNITVEEVHVETPRVWKKIQKGVTLSWKDLEFAIGEE